MLITFYSSGKEIASALNISLKLKHFTHCNTGSGVQHVNNDDDYQNTVVMSLSKPSTAAMSGVDRRRAISNMTTIISGEELAANIDDKNRKCTSKTIFFWRSKSF